MITSHKLQVICPLTGKRYKLHEYLYCPDKFPPGYYRWNIVGYREVRADEYYISGAIPELYHCPNDISQKHLVAELIESSKVSSVKKEN